MWTLQCCLNLIQLRDSIQLEEFIIAVKKTFSLLFVLGINISFALIDDWKIDLHVV